MKAAPAKTSQGASDIPLSHAQISDRITNFSWVTSDHGQVELFIGTESGFTKHMPLPSPHDPKQPVQLEIAPQVFANFSWDTYSRDGVTVASLKVSFDRNSFVAIQNPNQRDRWLAVALKQNGKENPHFSSYWLRAM